MLIDGASAAAQGSADESACCDRQGTVADFAVAQQLSWRGAGADAVGERLNTIHQNVSIAPRALNSSPLVGRKVVHNFKIALWYATQILAVVNHDVGRRAGAQKAAINEPCGAGR